MSETSNAGLSPLYGTRRHQRKFEAEGLAAARQACLSLGAALRFADTTERDAIFVNPAERELFFKVRSRSPGEDDVLVLQGRDQRRIVPLEIRDTVAATAMVESLGFVRTGEVCKQRTMLLLGPVNVKLDLVEGLGSFIELATLFHDPAHADSARAAVADLTERLAALLGEETELSYSAMLGLV